MPEPSPDPAGGAFPAADARFTRGDRLVIFADSQSPIGTRLAAAALRAASKRPGLAVAAVCDVAPGSPPPLPWRALEICAAAALERIFAPAARTFRPPALLGSLRWSAWRNRVRFLVPPRRDVNAPEFIARLRDELRPTVALSLVSLQIFTPELLALFEVAVNYHNAILPSYRGLRATGWSLYHGERRSGFTFHHMTRVVDGGNVLLSGSLEVPAEAEAAEVEAAKTRLAASRLDELLDLVAARAAGAPQVGTPSYFSHRACQAMTRIALPQSLTYAELQRRLRAFGVLTLHLGGGDWEVTRLVPSSRQGPTSFCTADGVVVTATRFRGLPRPLYLAARRIRAIVSHG